MIESTKYAQWLKELKLRIRQSQIKAAIKVNVELLQMYWDMGKNIATKQMDSQWGSGFFEQLSRDLRKEFPDMQGFSVTNLKYIKRFYLLYCKSSVIRPQVVDELEYSLFQVPWGHHRFIIDKCKSSDEALFYIQMTIKNAWSRNVLVCMMETGMYEAQGKALTNFSTQLPAPMSDLAQQTLKDPYVFDFLSMREGYDERDLENALIDNITRFLLELGTGFSYLGRQIRLVVGGDEFWVDVLFYHVKLHCYIVLELKNTAFSPAFLGQLGFYVEAVNQLYKQPMDGNTIGLLICRNKNKVVAEWALKSTSQPLGISEFQLKKVLPKKIKSSLPSIEEIERELNNGQQL